MVFRGGSDEHAAVFQLGETIRDARTLTQGQGTSACCLSPVRVQMIVCDMRTEECLTQSSLSKPTSSEAHLGSREAVSTEARLPPRPGPQPHSEPSCFSPGAPAPGHPECAHVGDGVHTEGTC